MGEEAVKRRLAAILAADVVGYSGLMEANEERTLQDLRQHRREFFDPTVAKHSGRIFKVMGDGFLVEFGSVIDAARCAVEIQTGMHDRNVGVPNDRKINFRIGINVGDIIVDGEDSTAMASTWHPGSKRLRRPAALPARRWCVTRLATNSKSSSSIRARRPSKT